jgi:hypothetical protein
MVTALLENEAVRQLELEVLLLKIQMQLSTNILEICSRSVQLLNRSITNRSPRLLDRITDSVEKSNLPCDGIQKQNQIPVSYADEKTLRKPKGVRWGGNYGVS